MVRAVCKLCVDLVGKDHDVRAAQYIGDGLKILSRHDGSRGIVGVGKHQKLCFRRNGRSQLIGCKLKFVFFLGVDEDGYAAAKVSYGSIANESGLWNYHLVTGIY